MQGTPESKDTPREKRESVSLLPAVTPPSIYVLSKSTHALNMSMSGCIQDWEHMQCLGTCGAPMYLQGVTQGEWVPAECLSRSEKKADFSFYSSPALYNRWVMRRKELNKKAVTCY